MIITIQSNKENIQKVKDFLNQPFQKNKIKYDSCNDISIELWTDNSLIHKRIKNFIGSLANKNNLGKVPVVMTMVMDEVMVFNDCGDESCYEPELEPLKKNKI